VHPPETKALQIAPPSSSSVSGITSPVTVPPSREVPQREMEKMGGRGAASSPEQSAPSPKSELTNSPRWSWTARRLVTEEELSSLSPQDRKIMRNEIYARHGMVFREPQLRDYFEKQSWYRPEKIEETQLAAHKQEVDSRLNKFEKENLERIIKFDLKKRGQ